MVLSGPSGARAYLKRYENDPEEIDETLASLLQKGYIQWDTVTEQFTMTPMGILETHEGTMH